MTKRSHGHLAGRSRHLARHHKPSELNTGSLIKEFSIGDMVTIIPKGNSKNIPHPRYRGRTGTVVERRGSAYIVELRMMSAKRRIVVPSIHLETSGAAGKTQG
jgi:large subunit ribosomal protein L21e